MPVLPVNGSFQKQLIFLAQKAMETAENFDRASDQPTLNYHYAYKGLEEIRRDVEYILNAQKDTWKKRTA